MFEEILEIYKTKSEEKEKERREAQGMVTLVTALDKMFNDISLKQRDVELLGRLVEQVDRMSKEVADLKSQFKARQMRAVAVPEQTTPGEGKALDKHARALIDLMAERPNRYTTNELVDMLGLNKTTVISVMKRAMELDPRHVKMSQGKRRKLFLTYIPDEESQIVQSDASSNDTDRMKLELMAMT
jgi:hypothetical protein